MEQLKSNRLYLTLIALFAFLLFANTIGHDFAWDDKIVLIENERVQEGISGIPDLFSKYNSGLLQDKYGYRPVTLTTFAVEFSLFGLNPAGFHFMNVLYFVALCVVIFLFIRRIFSSIHPGIVFLITLLFAAHPIHSEVVANIKSRDEILALLFGLLFLLYSLKSYQQQRLIFLLPAGIFFVLAYLSRENAITYLALLPLVLLTQTALNKKILLRSLLLLPVLAIIAIAFYFYAQNSNLGQEETIGMGIFQENHILGNSFFHDAGFLNKMGNAVQLSTMYVCKFLVPYPLTYYSGSPQIIHWSTLAKIGSLLFLIGILLVLPFMLRKKNPLVLFGALFFFITLSVYLHVAQSLSDTMADRFLFGPSLGLCIMLGGVLFWLQQKWGESKTEGWKEIPSKLRYAALGLAAVFTCMSFVRNRVWADDFTLVSSDLPHLDNCARAHYYYATELNQQLVENGWNSQTERDMIKHYRRSMELSDMIYFGRLELATYYLNHDAPIEGQTILEEMTTLFPEAADPFYFLGQRNVQVENYPAAVINLEKCLELAPNSHDAVYLLSISYGKTGKAQQGLDLAFKGLNDYPEAKGNMYDALGHIYYDMGNLPSSVQATLTSIQFGRDPYTSYATVIGRFQALGDSVNALRFYQEAVQRGIMQAPAAPGQ